MAGTYNFTLEQGTTFRRTITWRDQNNALINLTGASAKLQIRDRTTGATIKELTQASGLTLGGAAGTIIINISAADSSAWSFDSAKYDLEVTIASEVTRLLSGVVTLSSEVTV